MGQEKKYNICKISQSEFTHQNLFDLRAFFTASIVGDWGVVPIGKSISVSVAVRVCVRAWVRSCVRAWGREVSLGARASEPKFVGLRAARALPGGRAVSRAETKKFCFFGI